VANLFIVYYLLIGRLPGQIPIDGRAIVRFK